MSDDGEDCQPCKDATAVAFSVDVCKAAKRKGISCEKLRRDVVKGKVTVDEHFKKLRDIFKDDPDTLERVDELDRLRHEPLED